MADRSMATPMYIGTTAIIRTKTERATPILSDTTTPLAPFMPASITMPTVPKPTVDILTVIKSTMAESINIKPTAIKPTATVQRMTTNLTTTSPGLHSLPNEILFQIADNFLDDYFCWKDNFPYLFKIMIKSQATLNRIPYIAFAHTHPFLWELLHAKLIKADLKRAGVGNEEGTELEAKRLGKRGRKRLREEQKRDEARGGPMKKTKRILCLRSP